MEADIIPLIIDYKGQSRKVLVLPTPHADSIAYEVSDEQGYLFTLSPSGDPLHIFSVSEKDSNKSSTIDRDFAHEVGEAIERHFT